MSAEKRSDDDELREAAERAFEKWYAGIQEGDWLRLLNVAGNDLETLARGAWLAAVAWADGKTIVGAIPGGEEGSPGMQIVAYVKIRALAHDGQHTSVTIVASDVDEDGSMARDMPSLLVTGCGEAVKKVLDKMGYVNVMGRMVMSESGPEGKVM